MIKILVLYVVISHLVNLQALHYKRNIIITFNQYLFYLSHQQKQIPVLSVGCMCKLNKRGCMVSHYEKPENERT